MKQQIEQLIDCQAPKELVKEPIMIKSKFRGWVRADAEASLNYAKWKVKAITTGGSDLERLAMVNDCLRGINYSLKDLA